MGVWVLSTSNNVTIQNNEVRNNAHEYNVSGQGLVFDGIEIQGSNNTVTSNLSTSNFGNGIDNIGGVTGNQFLNNTLEDNGIGFIQGNNAFPEGSGIRVYGSQQNIKWNIIRNNRAPGLLIVASAKQNNVPKILCMGMLRSRSIYGQKAVGFRPIRQVQHPMFRPMMGKQPLGGIMAWITPSSHRQHLIVIH